VEHFEMKLGQAYVLNVHNLPPWWIYLQKVSGDRSPLSPYAPPGLNLLVWNCSLGCLPSQKFCYTRIKTFWKIIYSQSKIKWVYFCLQCLKIELLYNSLKLLCIDIEYSKSVSSKIPWKSCDLSLLLVFIAILYSNFISLLYLHRYMLHFTFTECLKLEFPNLILCNVMRLSQSAYVHNPGFKTNQMLRKLF
jgi:hypothetical protein